MKQKIILIGNPTAGSGALRSIERAEKIIKDRGLDVELMLTEKKGDAEIFAKRIGLEFEGQSSELNNKDLKLKTLASASRPRRQNSKLLIIAAGGDGTFNEVINGIAYTDVPLAILPFGTTNVLAKELNIPENNIEDALDIALSNRIRNVSLGKITFVEDGSSEIQTRYFCLMAGIGYDGEVVYGITSKIKRFSGRGAYVWSGLTTLMKWNPEKLTFDIGGRVYEGYSAIICNASRYAGNFRIAPDADISSPYLNVFIMHGKKRLDVIKYIYGIMTKRHLKFADVSYLQAEQIQIKGNANIQTDGDYLGKTPAIIEIVPSALRMVY
ncbi:MAG: diacylglycerol kinase family lipid kinase [Nitrospirae bacterium]|nr:diacylglycerol kinase family lipid kinase [Nitrospirota bacterium]